MPKRKTEDGQFEAVYERVNDGEDDEEGLLCDGESKMTGRTERPSWRISAKALTSLNIFLTIVLIAAWAVSAASKQQCMPQGQGLEPPYSPLLEDDVVRYVNKVFKPEKIFQSETTPEVEAAWLKTLGSTDGVIQLPRSKASRLKESIESFVEKDQFIYGVGMFHQLHCLNRIRKSFYADKFYPNETKGDIDFHKNHCLDLLRQSILCAGDVSMVYWWNRSYTYLDDSGHKQYSQKFLAMDAREKARGAFAFWDVPAQCRDSEAIYEWTERHRVNMGVSDELFNGTKSE
ncbi:hypothetical protein FQN55_007825 [Onygenales sp. PD_40]|nr:hypothetical protein FQN55_007825 [Onygenales sp. PD_40]KAK2787316.1 hypothetical protein FQN53_005475 [Emmonsiellopsis sp. PD_33]KAK2792456.1 hypothetical protein FQN52_003391 [Onygenales sp. PD_12]KAK2795644.1 hypothetical protein FQN51_000401 [Onygenales sp. PD_10]